MSGFVWALAACGGPPTVSLHPEQEPPDKLSEWGVVFANGEFLELNDEVFTYDLNAPLFSDYALKLRTIWIPKGTGIRYRDSGAFDFPVGTIISKSFHYRKADNIETAGFRVARYAGETGLDRHGRLGLDEYVLLETRLLVNYDDGWRAFPYVWNETQDEAFLEIAGDVRDVELVADYGSESFVYVVPDRNQCAGCHVTNLDSKALEPLGPRAWQLDRDYAYADGNVSQLEHWSATGRLTDRPDNPNTRPAWSNAPLEQRVKAYLDANCAHCHNENGPADTSALDLSFDAPVDRGYGVCKPPVAVGRGSGDRPYDIVPGNPDASILVYRMEQNDPAIAMPELGRATVHAEGLALVREWIELLPGEC